MSYHDDHKNDSKSVASLIYFRDGITLKEVETVIEELKQRGLITHSKTQDYIDAFGGPVLYFP